MDKKLHEDLNRIRKLSGLNEQTPSHQETLPDGTKRQWYYQDKKPEYGPVGTGNRQDPWDAGDGPGNGFGNGPGSGLFGNGPGAGTQGNRYGQ